MHQFELVLYLEQCFDRTEFFLGRGRFSPAAAGPWASGQSRAVPRAELLLRCWVDPELLGRSVVSESEEEGKMGENR